MKILKTVHLFCACCWLGGAISMLCLNLASGNAPAMLPGINYASHLVDLWVVVVFGVYGCIGTGLVYGFFTPWGFFRHRWLLAKWLITLFCFLSGWFLLGRWESSLLAISAAAGGAALNDPHYWHLKNLHLYMGFLQVALLILLLAISVLKPRFGK